MDNQRTGSTNRINPDRYFHVMNQGWFVYTREGVQGPYDKRQEAESYLTSMDDSAEIIIKNDNNDDWRM